jgi:hypothetical protein
LWFMARGLTGLMGLPSVLLTGESPEFACLRVILVLWLVIG